MKKTTTFIVVTIVLFGGVLTHISKGALVGHYGFEGNANDLSGNGNNGTINGGATFTTDPWGNQNSALHFDGIDDYVVVSSEANFDLNEFSILMTVRVEDPGGSGTLISKGKYFGNYSVYFSSTGSPYYVHDIASGNSCYYICWNVPCNEYFQLAVTYSESTGFRGYLNGSPGGAWADMPAPIFTDYPVSIGVNGGCSSDRFFSGDIDEVRIYDSVLTDAEIKSVYQAALPGGQPTLYHVNAAGGADFTTIQAAIDAAGNGDEIEVAPGTYNENIDFKGKGIRLYSSGGASVTTIQGDGTRNVVECAKGEESDTILEGFTVTGGYNTGWAGGMSNFGTNPTVINCTFTGNVAEWGGAGMWNGYASPTVIGCTFSNNSGKWGGGMCTYYGSPTVANCTFRGNSASTAGAGIYNWGVSSPTLTNCTFVENVTGGWAAGMYNSGDTNTTVANCILWGNSPDSISGTPSVTYSNVEGGWDGEGNIDADPLFVNESLALSMLSPCIDAGDNDAVPAGVTTDLAGKARVSDGNADGDAVVDMGAYEFEPGLGDAPTLLGGDVSVDPADASGATPVTITFSNVTESGYTHLETSSTPGHDAPPTFKFGTPPTYYGITTSATYAGDITVCISFDPSTFTGPVSRLRLLHYENGKWVDCTEIVDVESGMICGIVPSLSPFAVVESTVEIDVKPGSYPNSFNLNGSGVIPVAVLGSDAFNVRDIDTSTLDFAGLAVRVKGNGAAQCSYEDTNGDGYEDMVCQFVDDPDSWVAGDAEATLTGNLMDETPFAATDEINLVP